MSKSWIRFIDETVSVQNFRNRLRIIVKVIDEVTSIFEDYLKAMGKIITINEIVRINEIIFKPLFIILETVSRIRRQIATGSRVRRIELSISSIRKTVSSSSDIVKNRITLSRIVKYLSKISRI